MKNVYIIIRIPKSGSRSLENSTIDALAPANVFKVPGLSNWDAQTSFVEKLRATRKKYRRIWNSYHTLSTESMWGKINEKIADGDVVSGHVHYGTLNLIDSVPKYITIIRNPVDQFKSEYKWVNHGYNKRNVFQKIYHRGRLHAASRSMDYYLDFLLDQETEYSNPATLFVSGSASHPDPFQHLINNYWLFGVLDRADIFANDFSLKTGKPYSLDHLNQSPSNLQIALSPSQNKKFERLYHSDIELYDKTKSYLLNKQQETT